MENNEKTRENAEKELKAALESVRDAYGLKDGFVDGQLSHVLHMANELSR